MDTDEDSTPSTGPWRVTVHLRGGNGLEVVSTSEPVVAVEERYRDPENRDVVLRTVETTPPIAYLDCASVAAVEVLDLSTPEARVADPLRVDRRSDRELAAAMLDHLHGDSPLGIQRLQTLLSAGRGPVTRAISMLVGQRLAERTPRGVWITEDGQTAWGAAHREEPPATLPAHGDRVPCAGACESGDCDCPLRDVDEPPRQAAEHDLPDGAPTIWHDGSGNDLPGLRVGEDGCVESVEPIAGHERAAEDRAAELRARVHDGSTASNVPLGRELG